MAMIGLHLASYARNPTDPAQTPAVYTVSISGLAQGVALPGLPLTGVIAGLVGPEVITHRWFANGVLLDEADTVTFNPSPGLNVPNAAVLQYAPLIDGVSRGVAEVSLAPLPLVVAIEGLVGQEAEPNQTLTGVISGLLGGEIVQHRWFADEVLLLDEVSELFTPIPTINVADGAVLRYAPIVDGVDYTSPPVSLTLLPQVDPPQSLPRLVGVARMGQTLTLDISMLSTVTGIRYFLDDIEIQGQTGPSIVVGFMGVVSCEVSSSEGVFLTPAVRILHNHAMASHNSSDDAVLALVGHDRASHIAIGDGDWSDPAIWDVGSVPGPGARVLIPIEKTIRYDSVFAPRLDTIRIDGTLTWALDRSTDMLVETIVVQPFGSLVIGDAVDNRLPAQFQSIITFSNRAYSVDSTAPTDLDLANDPTLIGRGLLSLGHVTLFGHHRAPFVRTAPGFLPVQGDSSVLLEEVPLNWQVGDTVIIPGTVTDIDATGFNHRQDEERVITGITGQQVTFDGPLLHDHHHQSTLASVVARTDFQLPILVKDRNIVFRSEAGAAIHQRGHKMYMHGASLTDVWDVASIELGRTDKSKPAGIIENGQFRYFESGTRNEYFVPLTADANIQSRYPEHFHFVGFDKIRKNLIRDCYVEDAKAWAMVHHGARADWRNNVMYRIQGAGMVSETGDELGVWDGNVVCGLDTSVGDDQHPKIGEQNEGLMGDFARHGYGFFYRGRAMVTTRNIAIGMGHGHVFYHRSRNNGLGDRIQGLRENVDLHDLGWLSEGQNDYIANSDYPIVHFDGNESIGCFAGLVVVKNHPRQNHDVNVAIRKFKSWACSRGILLDYIGGYALLDIDLTSWQFSRIKGPDADNHGVFTAKVDQVAFDRVTTTGFISGLALAGDPVEGGTNNGYDAVDNPKFIVAHHQSVDDQQAVGYEDAQAQPVTKFMPQVFPYMDQPSIDLDFIICDWAGGNSSTDVTNRQIAIKTDTVSSGGIVPKPNDNAGFPYGGFDAPRIKQIAQQYGYWTYNGDNIVLVPLYFSDRLTAVNIKQMHAIRLTGSVAPYTNNGAFDRSVSPPTCSAVTRVIAAGASDTFNVLTAANVVGAAGTSLSVGHPFMTAIWGGEPAHFKPDYGALDIAQDGTTTYTPDSNHPGSDKMFAYAYDGQGGFCTAAITFIIQAI